MFFFLLLRNTSSSSSSSSYSSSSSFSDGLVQICDSFTMVSTQNNRVFHWAVYQPIAFSRFEVTRGDSNRSRKNYGFLYDAIFSSRVRMCTNQLATKCNYYLRLLNWKYSWCAGSVWRKPVILQQMPNFSSSMHLLLKSDMLHSW